VSAVSNVVNQKCVPILYCDLDGTVRHGKDELGHFVNAPWQVQIFDGVEDLLWKYRALGWRIVGISNQGGVGLGFMDAAVCDEVMHQTNRLTRYAFDEIQWCPHKPDANCVCRKPKTGMLNVARRNLALRTAELYPSNKALFVGDRPEDEQCAKNAGIRFMDAQDWREGKHLKEIT
jgi:D-glycero-D-manno-heptose 1,7-bisphosphate phosphatase